MDELTMRVTGTMIAYFSVCPTEAWYYVNSISYNDEDENIRMGRLIHRRSFQGHRKNVSIDQTISLDYISNEGNELVVFEIKKSSRLPEAAKNQLLYYLYYLKERGVLAKGIITYPEERGREEIELSEESSAMIRRLIEGVRKVAEAPVPPKPILKPYCRKCSYYQFCWS